MRLTVAAWLAVLAGPPASPSIYDSIEAAAAVLAIIAFVYGLFKFSRKLTDQQRRDLEVSVSQRAVETVDAAMERLRGEMASYIARIDRLELQLAAANDRILRLEEQLGHANGERARVEKQLNEAMAERGKLELQLEQVNARAAEIERRIGPAPAEPD